MGFVQLPIGSSPLFLLDEITTPSSAAYGFDPLSSSFSGPTAKIYTDSASIDCYNSSEVKALLALNPCFVETLYDQSGNDLDLLGNTIAEYPEVLEDANGYLYFNCIGGEYLRADPFIGSQTNSTMHILWQSVSDTAAAPLPTTFQGSMDFDANAANILPAWWQSTQSPTLSNVGATPFNIVDNQPRQHIFKWLSGTQYAFEFASNGRNTNTITNPTFARLTLGKTVFQPGNTRFYQLAFWAADVDEQILFDVTKANFPAMFTVAHLRLPVGDSNTAAGFVGTSLQWPYKFYVTKGYTEIMPSRALGGRTIQDYLDHVEDLEFYFQNFTYNRATPILFLGTNDLVLNGTTGADAYAKLVQLAQALRAAGATRIAAITMLPRTAAAPFSTERDAFNTLLIANAADEFYHVINTTANPNLQDQNNTTYFVDTTHLSATGQTELANMVAAAL